VYQWLYEAHEGEVGRYLPRMQRWDPRWGRLSLELLDRTQPVGEYQRGRGRFPEPLARATGEALGRVHSLKAPEIGGWEPLGPPWVLSFHRPELETICQVSRANLSLIRLVQRFPEFGHHLDDLRGEWQDEAFIHGDARWDNFLIEPRSRSKTRLKIVDWEFAGLGDPCWDVGSIFSEYLCCWLFSLPLLGSEPAERFLDLAQFSLPRMKPAIRAFWNAYALERKLPPSAAPTWLERSVRYAAAKMIQTGFERMQSVVQLDGGTICLLQVSLNILRRPGDAAFRLLGIAEG
jgi:aminoglycoside phosphotransferase (APT) family kinase protein